MQLPVGNLSFENRLLRIVHEQYGAKVYRRICPIEELLFFLLCWVGARANFVWHSWARSLDRENQSDWIRSAYINVTYHAPFLRCRPIESGWLLANLVQQASHTVVNWTFCFTITCCSEVFIHCAVSHVSLPSSINCASSVGRHVIQWKTKGWAKSEGN